MVEAVAKRDQSPSDNSRRNSSKELRVDRSRPSKPRPSRTRRQPLRLAQEPREPHRQTGREVRHLRCRPLHLKTARAYQIRLAFQDLFNQPAENAKAFLDKWYFWATHCRIRRSLTRPNPSAAIRMHPPLVHLGINNGILEASTAWSKPPRPKPEAIAPNAPRHHHLLIAGKLDLACNPRETAKNPRRVLGCRRRRGSPLKRAAKRTCP